MKFKIDENLPVEIAELLRSARHDAMMVTEAVSRIYGVPCTSAG
jgi:hypothetical protein